MDEDRPPPGLPVDWIPRPAHGLAGRLGLSCAPGAWHTGVVGDWRISLEADLRALTGVHRADVLVTLLDREELDHRVAPRFLDRIARAGLESLWLPIPDDGVPGLDEAVALVARIRAALGAGRTVVVHCLAGLGRTGPIAACVLVASGRTAEEAIEIVRAERPGALGAAVQEGFVRRYAGARPVTS